MPIPQTAKGVGDLRRQRHPLACALDAMIVDETGIWVAVAKHTNTIPAAIVYAQRRNPGRRYVWELENGGVRVWRTA